MLSVCVCVILEYGVCDIFYRFFHEFAGALVVFFLCCCVGSLFFGIFSLPTHCKFDFKRVAFFVFSFTRIGRSLVFAGFDTDPAPSSPSCIPSVEKKTPHNNGTELIYNVTHLSYSVSKMVLCPLESQQNHSSSDHSYSCVLTTSSDGFVCVCLCAVCSV